MMEYSVLVICVIVTFANLRFAWANKKTHSQRKSIIKHARIWSLNKRNLTIWNVAHEDLDKVPYRKHLAYLFFRKDVKSLYRPSIRAGLK